MNTRRHAVTFTTAEIITALRDAYESEFSDQEIQEGSRLTQLDYDTWEVRYESAVLG